VRQEAVRDVFEEDLHSITSVTFRPRTIKPFITFRKIHYQ
jgi:hypothetical protein